MTWLPWCWLGLTLLAFLVWMGRHAQIGRINRVLPPLHAEMYTVKGDRAAALPPVSMIVAAKDEASNIETCVRSILDQDYPDLEVIAVDDRSADRTGEIIDALADEFDALTALHVKALRPGWFGKCNAMAEGVQRARGQWLCFTDADCSFTSQRLLSVAMRYALEIGADFLSVLPGQETNSFWERVIQPACSGILLIWFNPQKVNDPKSRTAYANGAFMLMQRSCYEAIGGHEAVRNAINEDMHLARRAKEAGRRLVVASNEGLYSVRMYESLAQIWAGWTRIFYGCFESFRRIALSMLAVTVMSLLPWLALGTAGAVLASGGEAPMAWRVLLGAAAATCAAQLSVMFRFYAMNRSNPFYGLLYPAGALFGLAMLGNALRHLGGRRRVVWRGTSYRGTEVEPVGEVV